MYIVITSIRAISIHSLRVEGDGIKGAEGGTHLHFNPLPPCGGRLWRICLRSRATIFQSTPSVWRETQLLMALVDAIPISIHSLRVEGDHVRPWHGRG